MAILHLKKQNQINLDSVYKTYILIKHMIK